VEYFSRAILNLFQWRITWKVGDFQGTGLPSDAGAGAISFVSRKKSRGMLSPVPCRLGG
jgi:hypothetical protein